MIVPDPMQGDQTDEELTLLTLSSCVIYLQTDESFKRPYQGTFWKSKSNNWIISREGVSVKEWLLVYSKVVC